MVLHTRRTMRPVLVVPVFVLLFSVACNTGAPPEPSSTPAPAKPAPVEAPKPAVTAPPPQREAPAELGISWEDPAEWTRFRPKSSARAANYTVPLVKGDEGSAEVTVFYFGPGMGGTVESNIARWVGQFSDVKETDVKRSTATVNGLSQHIVSIESGSYGADMMMGGPHAQPSAKQSGQGLLAAVVESPSGLYFFKLTGPSKTVTAARPAFDKLLQSMKPKAG